MLNQVQHDTAGQGGFLIRLMARRNDNSIGSGECDKVNSHKNLVTSKVAFTMADRLSRLYNGLTGLRSAFTMAEILLSLTIIGVVAAITLPSLTGNINERTWNTQRKALYSRMSQAVSLMPSMNGYGIDGGVISENAAETFLSAGLSKVLKINNICDSKHLFDCGVASKIITVGSSKYVVSLPWTTSNYNPLMISHSEGNFSYDGYNTNAAAFETANGESIVLFYYPKCQSYMGEFEKVGSYAIHYIQPKICVNMIYDLNGKKGPNTVGKDVGTITVLYSSDSVVAAPVPASKTLLRLTFDETSSACKQNFGEEYRVPNIYELSVFFGNRALYDFEETGGYYLRSSKSALGSWAGSAEYEAGVPVAFDLSVYSGFVRVRPKAEPLSLRCVKR